MFFENSDKYDTGKLTLKWQMYAGLQNRNSGILLKKRHFVVSNIKKILLNEKYVMFAANFIINDPHIL